MNDQVRTRDREILRDLAKQYIEICQKDDQEESRQLWRNNNSLIKTRPPVLCSWHWGSDTAGEVMASACVCEDPSLRGHELWLRNMLFHDMVDDDHIFEPWIRVRAAVKGPLPGEVLEDIPLDLDFVDKWGIQPETVRDPGGHGWRRIPVIKTRGDVKRLLTTHHEVDKDETARRINRLQDILGDILEVDVDRSSYYGLWGGSDLSEALGLLRGLQEFMMDIYEQPELLHEIVGFMRDAVVINFEECEAASDWKQTNHQCLAVPYCRELPDPVPNVDGVKMKDLWFFTCAQEFTVVSPRHHWEFMLQYQMSVMEKFGLISYGCCEDLTNKINLLRRIPNLRRIGVAPCADICRCADQIGRDYVLSWRPNPAMVCVGFDPEYVRSTLRDGLEVSRHCNVEIMLKDVTTVQGEPQRLVEWTRIAKELVEEF